jgi:hypothetical protein
MPNDTDKKLDLIIRLLEDSFILQALSTKFRRDDICSILGVHTSRVSKIASGLKRGNDRK